MFVTQCVRRSATLTPDKPALVCGDRTTSFGELQDRVARCAGGMRNLGLKAGERVAILGLNSDRLLEIMYGVIWAGGVANSLNLRWAVPELVYAITDSGAAILIVDKNFVDRVAPLREKCPSIRQVIYVGDDAAPAGMVAYESMVSGSEPIPDQCTDTNDIAFLNYTGGTTGMSKGVMLTHAALLAGASIMLTDNFFVQGQKTGLVLPLFHIAGAVIPLSNLMVGNTIVVMPAFAPLDAIKLIHEQRIGQIVLVPTMIQMVVDHPQFGDYDLSCLKHLHYGGSPISEALVKRAREKLPHAKLMQIYGQTEGLPATILPDEDHHAEGLAKGRLRSAGRPSPFCEVRILDAEGKRLGAGEVGEIIFSGPHLMTGYWNKPELSANTLIDGWLHTGDVGYVDSHGYLYVVDRLKDMIVSGGENVYSSEVENAIAKHPAVAGCVVIAVPDPKWGEAVHAVVALKEGHAVSEEALAEHCKELIAGYKVPRSFEFRSSLPFTPVGKVDKVSLRAPHWIGHVRRVS